jgi:hypothetical protein
MKKVTIVSQFFKKCLFASKKSHAHLRCVHKNSAKFGESQQTIVRGTNHTMFVLSIQNVLEQDVFVEHKSGKFH